MPAPAGRWRPFVWILVWRRMRPEQCGVVLGRCPHLPKRRRRAKLPQGCFGVGIGPKRVRRRTNSCPQRQALGARPWAVCPPQGPKLARLRLAHVCRPQGEGAALGMMVFGRVPPRPCSPVEGMRCWSRKDRGCSHPRRMWQQRWRSPRRPPQVRKTPSRHP